MNFISSIRDLTSGKAIIANLRAMSDFALTVIRADSVAHFAAKFTLADSLTENSANMNVKVETQLLDALASELKLLPDRANL